MTQDSTIPPQEDINQILQLRRDKLTKLRAQGINPYPYTFAKDTHIPDLLADFDSKVEGEEHSGPAFSIAGRLHTIRLMGKAAFCHVRDEFGMMQVYVQRDRVGEDAFAVFKTLDIGDIVGFCGTAFRTKTAEPSLRAQSFELLSKSLHPLPVVKEREGETYDAFTDKESRFRQRYVDLAVNPDVRQIFRTRARIISTIRRFLDERGYLEVETPTLQTLYGGALAKPFTTFYNALGRHLYLRIADELYLKRLLIGGFEKVYEICKDFRNEGMDRYHNPEFTMLEFYQAYADYQEIMNLSEELFRTVVFAVNGSSEVHYQGETVDFGKPFRRVKFFDLLHDLTGKDLLGLDLRELGEIAKQHHVDITKDMGEGKILDEIMKTNVRPELREPTMIYDYPLSLSPLAKQHRSDPRLVERFQPFALGFELGNAFSELNDPLDQRDRFEKQRALKEAGDEETQPIDEDYLSALEYGMPPTGGMGIGVDRLTMLITDQEQISEVILFPHVARLRMTEWEIIERAKMMARTVDNLLIEANVQYSVGKRESGLFDLLIPFDQKWIVVEAKLPNHITSDYLRSYAKSILWLSTQRPVVGAIILVEKYEFAPGQLSVLYSEAKDLNISILDESTFKNMIKWLGSGARWILNEHAHRLHRPWCFFGQKIPKPILIKDKIPDLQNYRYSDCCEGSPVHPGE